MLEVQPVIEARYRPARPEDVPEMAELFLLTVADMYSRNNINAPVPPKQAVEAGYAHVLSTGIFHVAETDGKMAGIAGAVVRDGLWYLSAFWVRPEMQRKKIGMPLLRGVRDAGIEAGAETFFTWSSIDPAAMGSYMSLGMLPGYPIFMFEGAASRLPEQASGFESATLESTKAAEVDRLVRGTGRDADHAFWASRPGLNGRMAMRNGRLAGYFYHGRGTIGPVGWLEPTDAEAVLALALREASKEADVLRVAVPGVAHAALRVVLNAGLRVNTHFIFLSSAPFGRLEQYLPSGPGLY